MKSVVFEFIAQERSRQSKHLELIASENYVSRQILRACGSILTNKYAEGYPNKRYYGGCQFVDSLEAYAVELAKELFKAEHANVQPHSGSQANMAVYLAVLKPGDTVLGMDLNAGGHLTHGHPLNFSGSSYNFISYGVSPTTHTIDYQEVRKLAHLHKPKLIVAGASAYSRIIDFATFRQIADEVGAYLMVDMAHIAGLVAAALHPNPVPFAHFVTSTTHKTLRGPRGGLILCQQQFAKMIDKAVFPGVQGGPLMHIIAAKALCFEEAGSAEFVAYQKQVMANAKALANSLQEEGLPVITGSTDNHLILVDVYSATKLTGIEVETILESVNITCNKNTIPFDQLPPNKASGIRLGSPALTTRGFNEEEFKQIGKLIAQVIKNPDNKKVLKSVKLAVKSLTSAHRL